MTMTAPVGSPAGEPDTAGSAFQWSRSPAFLQSKTMLRRSAMLLLVGSEAARAADSLPYSGDQATIIADGLPHLPAGQVAVDPETGETLRPKKPGDG